MLLDLIDLPCRKACIHEHWPRIKVGQRQEYGYKCRQFSHTIITRSPGRTPESTSQASVVAIAEDNCHRSKYRRLQQELADQAILPPRLHNVADASGKGLQDVEMRSLIMGACHAGSLYADADRASGTITTGRRG